VIYTLLWNRLINYYKCTEIIINILPDLLHSEVINIILESLKELLWDIIAILDEIGELFFPKED